MVIACRREPPFSVEVTLLWIVGAGAAVCVCVCGEQALTPNAQTAAMTVPLHLFIEVLPSQ
jgi:hypothetical protein